MKCGSKYCHDSWCDDATTEETLTLTLTIIRLRPEDEVIQLTEHDLVELDEAPSYELAAELHELEELGGEG
jgi:hypothetical protein